MFTVLRHSAVLNTDACVCFVCVRRIMALRRKRFSYRRNDCQGCPTRGSSRCFMRSAATFVIYVYYKKLHYNLSDLAIHLA